MSVATRSFGTCRLQATDGSNRLEFNAAGASASHHADPHGEVVDFEDRTIAVLEYQRLSDVIRLDEAVSNYEAVHLPNVERHRNNHALPGSQVEAANA
ncbi:hypothetical protein [Aestuariivirga sp.]|uniref:hypothetical protein n=1 Tax=Aestuariivirga sp. TaxID=2650926 RepID=UPI0039E6E4E4